MSAQLSLLVTPTKLDNNEEGPPQFYVLSNAVWRDVPVAGGATGRPSEIRKSMDDRLSKIMESHAANPDGSLPALVTMFRDYWTKWIPERVQRDIADLPQTDGEPPCLMLYVHPTLEWIPWELMHDGTDFLGVRYVIARLPIVRRGPTTLPEKRVVRTVRTFLGEHLMDGTQQAEWEATFEGLPNGVDIARFPQGNGSWPTADQVTQQAATDILYITCHGGIKDDTFGTVWTLNAQGPSHVFGLGAAGVEQMAFGDQGPLVFGNACQGAAGAATATGLVPGLAYSFFDNGAAAFIGAFAPISKTTALKFATTFYGHLFGDGIGIGSALRRTKSDFRTGGERDPSWLYYCLYGPPGTQFVVP